MPSFAKKRRAVLRKVTLSGVQELCKNIELDGRQDNIRHFFKNAVLNLSALMTDKTSSFNFEQCDEDWLKATAKYLDHASVLSIGGRDRAAALILLRCHLLACLFRIDADIKSAPAAGNEIDKMICDALKVESISEIFI